MAQVICSRPNASDEISGVKFTKHEGGMLSEEISDEQAATFLSIDGYKLLGDEQDDDKGDDLEALRARAVELGIEVKGNWKAPRLAAEIKRAEEAAAAEGKTE